MSFESALASIGKLCDKVIDWHMSLSWPLLLLLGGLYFMKRCERENQLL